MQLVIGNKNYSSWSLRVWILMKHFGLEFEERMIWLYSQQMEQELAALDAGHKVPVLIDKGETIWDSLAICEYLNEQYLANKAMPENTLQRAKMRSICAQMHAGFFALRAELPMNCRRLVASIEFSSEAQSEVTQMIELLDGILSSRTNDVLQEGDYLFGRFTIADATFLPIMSRLHVYAIELPTALAQYQQLMLQHRAYIEWLEQARSETAIVPQSEV
jgi:glutathione S-transferase